MCANGMSGCDSIANHIKQENAIQELADQPSYQEG